MVSKAILVESSGDQFLFPIESVREMVKLDASEIHGIAAQRFIHIRGSVCPIVALSTILGQQERAATGGEQSAAIVRTRMGDVALIVDRLVAEIDVIVKPLSEGLDRLRMFQGASILGDGQVALVMDPSQLGAVAQAALSARLHA
jgi:two-component system chemotaxis sensor kinase CheA